LGERLVCNQEVAGSIPVVSIRFPLLSAVVTPPLPLSALPFRATPVACVAALGLWTGLTEQRGGLSAQVAQL
jgi:hypothetical protein